MVTGKPEAAIIIFMLIKQIESGAAWYLIGIFLAADS
jgi:hypothetical protein